MTSLKRPKPGILQLFVAPERREPIGIIPENIATALRSGGEIEQGSVGVEDAGLDSSERVLGHVPSSRFSAMIGCRELGGSSLVNWIGQRGGHWLGTGSYVCAVVGRARFRDRCRRRGPTENASIKYGVAPHHKHVSRRQPGMLRVLRSRSR